MTLQRFVSGSRHDFFAGNHNHLINRMVLIELGATCHIYHCGGVGLSYFHYTGLSNVELTSFMFLSLSVCGASIQRCRRCLFASAQTFGNQESRENSTAGRRDCQIYRLDSTRLEPRITRSLLEFTDNDIPFSSARPSSYSNELSNNLPAPMSRDNLTKPRNPFQSGRHHQLSCICRAMLMHGTLQTSSRAKPHGLRTSCRA